MNFVIFLPMAGAGEGILKTGNTKDCDLLHAAAKMRNMYVFPKFQLRNLAPKPYIPIYEKIIMLLP
jgi:hypothetical protein